MKKSKKAKIKLTSSRKSRDLSLRGLGHFFGRTFLIAMFIIYLIVGSMGTILWAKTKAHRSLKIENMGTRIMDYRKRKSIASAIFTAHVQKLSRSEEVIEHLLPLFPELEAPFYFEMSRRYVYLQQMDEAFFWHMWGSLHLRYDMMRCDGISDTEFLDFFLNEQTEPELVIYMRDNEEKMKDVMQRVMEWYGEYPLDGRPEYFCAMSRVFYGYEQVSGDVTPEIGWPMVAKLLGRETQAFVEQLSLSEKQGLEKQQLEEQK